MFERLGSATFRYRFLILLAWIAAGVFMATMAPSLAGSGSTDQTTFLPANAPSRVAKDALERAFPGSTSSSSATITMDRPAGLTDEDRAWRDDFAAWALGDDAPAELQAAATEAETADSRPELEELFRAPDGTFELFVINLNVAEAGDAAKTVTEQLREHVAATVPDGLDTHVTGAAAISSDYLEAVQAGTDSTTIVTVILVVLVLLAIYRAPLAALIPLVTIGAAYVVSTGILGFLAQAGWSVSSTLATFLVVMVFGVGTDYAIFLISRYREEVSHDGDWHDAAKITVKRIGAVITASAGTVIVGMLAMGVGDFKMIASMGPGIAIAIAVTLVAALTLSPALLSIFGHYLFWPLHTKEKHEGEPRGFFAGLAAAVSRRPVAWTTALLVILIIPALYLPQAESNFDVMADLPKTADSRIGYEQIGEHLGEDKLVQSTGLVDLGGDDDLLAPAQLARLHALMVALQEDAGVATTTSLVTPDGDTTVPDGFRPSATLSEIADGFEGDDGGTQETYSASLLDGEVEDGLNQALDYVNSLAVAFPDVAAGQAMRDAKGGLEHALDIVDRVQENAVLTTQLRTLATSITDPASAASSSGDDAADDDSTLMSDYLAELGAAYPVVKTLDAWKDGVKAARELEEDASIGAALTLADSFDALADHFEATDPDATLTPESLAGTTAAKELKREAEEAFGALPDQFAALSDAFTGRPDDFFIPTSLTGEDAEKLRDAIDAFVSEDGTATRFYLTSSNSPYSGGAFQTVKDIRVVMEAQAPGFGAAASAHVGGPIAQFTDVNDTLAKDFQKVGVITVLGVLVVLMLLLRAVVAPLYLVATVILSYATTIGLSAFIFQEVMGQPGISPYLPLMVFVLLVALGSDYNIFLMHRVREEAETRGMRDAVRIASGHTGAVITSAGLILAGTFGSMATAPLTILFQVGIAVAIGVLIDTFLVRSILVPAITSLVGDWAWWPSKMVHHIPGEAPVPVPVPLGAGAPVPVAAAAEAPVPAAAAGAAGAAGVGVGAAVAASWSPTGEALVTGDALVSNDAAQGTELARRTSRRRLAVGLALVVLLPLAVAGLLTWSLGGAFERIGSVQAAVVNLDEGGTMTLPDGTETTLALGDDLTVTLLAPGTGEGFTWVAADEAAAAAGLEDGRYAAVLTIPAEFSRSVAAIRSDTTGSTPQASLGIVTDDASGYALGTVARAVSAAIATSTAQGVTASYVDDVLLAVTDAQARLSGAAGSAADIADTSSAMAGDASGVEVFAGQLVDGLQQLVDGTSDTSGIDELVDGTAALADGMTKVADGQQELAKGTRAAASGAGKLADGAGQVASGAGTLADETASLPAQVDALADGAEQLAGGATQLAGGIGAFINGDPSTTPPWPGLTTAATLADGVTSGATQAASLAGDTADAAAGTAQAASSAAGDAQALAADVAALSAQCEAAYGAADPVCQGIAGLLGDAASLATATGTVAGMADGTSQLAQGTKAATGEVKTYATNLDAIVAGAVEYAKGLRTGANDLADGLDQYAAGVRTFADSAPQLANGISQLSTGTAGIASGASDLAAGLDTLAAGSAALARGAGKAADGAQTLADGVASNMGDLDQLTEAGDLALEAGRLVEAQAANLADSGSTISDDAQALADELDASASDVGSFGSEQRTRLSTLAADPIAVEATSINGVGGLQDGLAPFLMALAAWLGVMGTFLLLPAVWPGDERRWIRGVLLGFGAAAVVGLAASLVMVAGMVLFLGLAVASLPQLIGFTVLATLAFAAVVQALVALFGSRGWLVALLLLVLQAAAVGFPVAVLPGPIAALHPLLPMSYAVDALRGAITGAGSRPLSNAFALTAFLLVGLLMTLAGVAGQALKRGRQDEEAPAGA
jgi:RND superfamily putative drug exporter